MHVPWCWCVGSTNRHVAVPQFLYPCLLLHVPVLRSLRRTLAFHTGTHTAPPPRPAPQLPPASINYCALTSNNHHQVRHGHVSAPNTHTVSTLKPTTVTSRTQTNTNQHHVSCTKSHELKNTHSIPPLHNLPPITAVLSHTQILE